MSLNVKTPKNACIFHFRGGFKVERGDRGEWAWYFTIVCRIAHEGGGRKKVLILEHHWVGRGGGGGGEGFQNMKGKISKIIIGPHMHNYNPSLRRPFKDLPLPGHKSHAQRV